MGVTTANRIFMPESNQGHFPAYGHAIYGNKVVAENPAPVDGPLHISEETLEDAKRVATQIKKQSESFRQIRTASRQQEFARELSDWTSKMRQKMASSTEAIHQAFMEAKVQHAKEADAVQKRINHSAKKNAEELQKIIIKNKEDDHQFQLNCQKLQSDIESWKVIEQAALEKNSQALNKELSALSQKILAHVQQTKEDCSGADKICQTVTQLEQVIQQTHAQALALKKDGEMLSQSVRNTSCELQDISKQLEKMDQCLKELQQAIEEIEEARENDRLLGIITTIGCFALGCVALHGLLSAGLGAGVAAGDSISLGLKLTGDAVTIATSTLGAAGAGGAILYTSSQSDSKKTSKKESVYETTPEFIHGNPLLSSNQFNVEDNIGTGLFKSVAKINLDLNNPTTQFFLNLIAQDPACKGKKDVVFTKGAIPERNAYEDGVISTIRRGLPSLSLAEQQNLAIPHIVSHRGETGRLSCYWNRHDAERFQEANNGSGLEFVVGAATATARAAAGLHRLKIAHCSIAPQNILVHQIGPNTFNYALTDFDMSTLQRANHGPSIFPDPFSYKSDITDMGFTLGALLTGSKKFKKCEFKDTGEGIYNPNSLKECLVDAKVPKAFINIIDRIFEPDPLGLLTMQKVTLMLEEVRNDPEVAKILKKERTEQRIQWIANQIAETDRSLEMIEKRKSQLFLRAAATVLHDVPTFILGKVCHLAPDTCQSVGAATSQMTETLASHVPRTVSRMVDTLRKEARKAEIQEALYNRYELGISMEDTFQFHEDVKNVFLGLSTGGAIAKFTAIGKARFMPAKTTPPAAHVPSPPSAPSAVQLTTQQLRIPEQLKVPSNIFQVNDQIVKGRALQPVDFKITKAFDNMAGELTGTFRMRNTKLEVVLPKIKTNDVKFCFRSALKHLREVANSHNAKVIQIRTTVQSKDLLGMLEKNLGKPHSTKTLTNSDLTKVVFEIPMKEIKKGAVVAKTTATKSR